MPHWFTRRPGQSVGVEQESEVPGPVTMVVGLESPDLIRVPEHTPHADAGRELRVGAIGTAPCPMCFNAGERNEVRTYAFIDSDLLVSECGTHKFVWFELPKS